MRILTLRLENFQGIRKLELDLQGRNVNISGDNGTGKTTIYNAVTWLMFDKASTGVKNFSPKTKGEDGQDIHYLNHSVTATFRLSTGEITTLSKTLTENWKRKRGSISEEFSGHTTEYQIDGVPVSEGEYNATINEIVSPEQAKILTMTSYFPAELPWQARRKILLEVCGDITDDDVINSNPELGSLSTFLKKSSGKYYTVDEYLKIAGVKQAELNKEIDLIPARIDEAQKAIPDLAGCSLSQAEEIIRNTEQKKADLEGQKANITDDTATQELRKNISALQAALNNEKAEYLKTANAANEITNRTIGQLRERLGELQSEKYGLENKEKAAKTSLTEATQNREKLTARYNDEKIKEWQGDTTCGICGQPMPANQIQKVKDTWNQNKSEILKNIRQEIEKTCSKAIISNFQDELSKIQNDIDDVGKKIAETETQIKQEQTELSECEPFESTAQYKAAQVQIEHLEQEILSGRNNTTEAQKVLQEQIDGFAAILQNQAEIKAKFAVADMQNARIEELMEQEKALGGEYEKIQHGIYLCEEFIKTKVSLLTDSINAKFKSVSFRLFVQQINGGIKEDCEVLIPTENGLVPYSTANNAARINAGIEIINVLSKHWGVQMPLFVDNRESVIRLTEGDMQIISLIVSEAAAELKIEII